MKAMTAAAAIAAAAVFLHWALFQPEVIAPHELRGPVFVEILLGASANSTPPPAWFRQLNLVLIAAAGLLAAGLSFFILYRSELTAATRRLSTALALAPLSVAYFFFLATHPMYRQALHLDDTSAIRAALTFAAYATGLVSSCLLVRFFLGYPRAPGDEELATFYRKLHAERLAAVRRGWRKRVFGGMAAKDGDAAKPGSWRSRLSGGEPTSYETGTWRFFRSPWPIAAALLLAMIATGVDLYTQDPDIWGTKPARGLKSLIWAIDFMFIVVAVGAAFQGLQYHHREAIADDRVRIEWIYGALLVAGVIMAAIPPLWWAVLIVLLPSIEPSSASLSGYMMMFGPAAVGIEVFILAFVGSLALSIFYRGAVDPRLAVRRVTVFGVMGLMVAILFVAFERFVTMKVVAWMSLPQETGSMIAAALVAGSLAPVRATAQRAVNAVMSRFLPLESLMEGERKIFAVVICDISGYTALSARDEKQALLLAALLQRQAQKVSEEFNGRVVKSMGDAVILAFEDAAAAIGAMGTLHREFALAARLLGLEALPVHSGAHFGEATQTHDGDLYGQTVNVAARILSLAAPGQRIVSAELAAAASLRGAGLRSMGPRQLKNVPQPVECHEVVDAAC